MPYQVKLQSIIDAPWLTIESIIVGRRPAGAGTPDAIVTVERDGVPFARIDVYAEYTWPFTDAVAWGHLIALGISDAVYFVDPAARKTTTFRCDGYFGHLYPQTSCLLIASARELICVDALGVLLWRRSDLGIDGVVVEQVADGVISGSGEWDPPGGWREFRLSLVSGLPVSETPCAGEH